MAIFNSYWDHFFGETHGVFTKAWGVLENLPLDAQGTLQVTAPFCHDFFEVPGREVKNGEGVLLIWRIYDMKCSD